jgi:hypothetical protein
MAKRDYYANWKVIIGEGKDRKEILPGGDPVPLEETDDNVKTLVTRGALTPAPDPTKQAAAQKAAEEAAAKKAAEEKAAGK